jgi:hypothetical protein
VGIKKKYPTDWFYYVIRYNVILPYVRPAARKNSTSTAITEIEESHILRRTPLAILPSMQLSAPNDYVGRSVLGDLLLATRDKNGESHDFVVLPQCGEGVRHGQHDHMIIGRNEIGRPTHDQSVR